MRTDFTDAEVGRRVVYWTGLKGDPQHRGTISAVEPNGDAWVIFDGETIPLRVISNLTRAAE